MRLRQHLLLSLVSGAIAVLPAQNAGRPQLRKERPLGRYIFFAYKLEGFQAMEMQAQLPKWADDNYAVDAKAEGNPTKDQMRLMMQSLLADRFKLRVHFENREASVLALTLVKPGKLGPKLRPHSEGPSCPDSSDTDQPFAPIPPPKPGVA